MWTVLEARSILEGYELYVFHIEQPWTYLGEGSYDSLGTGATGD